MTIDGIIGVAEAAQHLQVSERRVRALLASGRLAGERQRHGWLIPAAAVANFAAREGGRPMVAPVARGCLALLAGQEPGWLATDVRSRLRHRMRARLAPAAAPWEMLRSWCSARAVTRPLRVLPPVLAEVAELEGVLLGGAARSVDLPAEVVDVYAAVEDFAVFGAQGMRAAGVEQPNLVLRLVGDRDELAGLADPVQPRMVGPAVAGLDLLEAGDPRAVVEGRRLIEQAVAGWGQAHR